MKKAPATNTVKTTLSSDRQTIRVRVPITFRQHRAGKQVITPPGTPDWSPPARVDNVLVRALARAHHWRELIESGKYGSAAELARAERVNDSYVSRILRLTLLAPDLVEHILDGRQPRTLELNQLMSAFPCEWSSQRERWTFSASSVLREPARSS